MSEPICTCHCGGSMFYHHLHADSCVLSREGEEAPSTPYRSKCFMLKFSASQHKKFITNNPHMRGIHTVWPMRSERS